MTSDIVAPIINYDRIRIKSDGDGIRTIAFFYGCPLRCKYCINQHSWNDKKKPKQYSIQELLKEVEIDSLYFQATNGGITFGGGEPLLYPDFVEQFIDIAPKEWNYWVETSLAIPFENVEKVARKITKFVVDIKSLDEKIYKSYTGKDVDLVYTNLKHLIELVDKEKIWVRVPYIPKFTTRKKQMATVNKLKELGLQAIETFDYIQK